MTTNQITGNSLAEVIGKINAGAGAAVVAIQTVKALRDLAKSLFPDAPEGTFPTDAELIQDFVTKAGLLQTEAKELRVWLESQLPKQEQHDGDQPDSGDN